MDPLAVFLVSGGMSEGARPFPLKIFDTKILVNSTSWECINSILDRLYKLYNSSFTSYQDDYSIRKFDQNSFAKVPIWQIEIGMKLN